MKKKIIALFLTAGVVASMLAGCGGSGDAAPAADAGADATATADADAGEEDASEDAGSGEVTNFTMFITMPGSEINDDNEIAQMIADKWGVKVKETWLTGQTASEATGTLIAGGEYPDFIDSDEMNLLIDADALIPLDDYIDKYPEFKETWFTPEEWEKFRQPDGHIYWINPFGNTMGETKQTTHNDEAFWIQVRVLEWAGYPEIHTMDQYFDLLESYIAANPTMEDGTENLAYTILCEDWRYFCLENAGQFLGGYPNDGSVIVNKTNMTIEDYNTSEDTIAYFKKLNEEYNKGFVDPESFTQTYDEYIAKLSTGRVLGMVDQWWDFAYTVNDSFKQSGLDQKGCNYVPLGLTTKEGMENRWHTYDDTVNQASGIAITTDCEDPDKAFKFLVDCAMDQELHDLRFWGVKGVDYDVDADGLYFRTPEQRQNWADTSYQAAHRCQYSYFPQWHGTSRDGKNANKPEEQPSEFMSDMAEPLKKCFDAYGQDFDKSWGEYMAAYEACKPEDFLKEMQDILDTFK